MTKSSNFRHRYLFYAYRYRKFSHKFSEFLEHENSSPKCFSFRRFNSFYWLPLLSQFMSARCRPLAKCILKTCLKSDEVLCTTCGRELTTKCILGREDYLAFCMLVPVYICVGGGGVGKNRNQSINNSVCGAEIS